MEQVVSSVASRRSGHLVAKVPGILEGGGDIGGDSKVEETLSMDDALLSVLEGTLEQGELLREIGDLNDPSQWARGYIHGQVEPAELVRVTCQAQLLDPEFFSSSVSRVVDTLEAMAIFGAGASAMAKSTNERSKIAKHATKELMGGLDPDLVRQLGAAIERFFGQGLFIRQLPCGPEYRPYALLGALRTDVDALLDDRAAIFSKYGAAPSSWSMLSQIATVTQPPAEGLGSFGGDADVSGDQVSADEDVDGHEDDANRADFERTVGDMMVQLESSGFSGGPVWPTITVTPIAVYRSSATTQRAEESR